jgi:type VI protein secretion system component VasK
MRLLAGLAMLVAVAALILTGIALRDSRQAHRTAQNAEAHAQTLSSQLAQQQTRLARLAPTAKAVRALCYDARHASVPPASNYALTVGRSIIKGIITSCAYGQISDVP